MFIVPVSQSTLFPTLGDAAKQNAQPVKGLPFADVLQQTLQEYTQAKAVSVQDSYDLSVGNPVDLPSLTIHAAQTTAALELTVEVASRAVSSYKEILQMQI